MNDTRPFGHHPTEDRHEYGHEIEADATAIAADTSLTPEEREQRELEIHLRRKVLARKCNSGELE
jgi:hypothetical protein